ncbi:MAG TPA: prepilin-type N-terminal cleavage/methylation domain-containing protein [Terriglobales bacterium]|nr:prepilin-type N-terminal cleavage/methylation domain-containing protein [Terriglobales bacterium]
MRRFVSPAQSANNQQGFTLVEVLISMFVLTVGLLSLLGVFAMAMAKTQSTDQDMVAKQLAQEAYEAIFTARETANISWAQIQNVGTGQVPDGIFVTGFQPIRQPGTDGILGTADDALAGLQTFTLPGADGIVGTSDDQVVSLTNFQRSIAITPIVTAGSTVADLRTITITIQYYTPQSKFPKNFVLSGFISQYR